MAEKKITDLPESSHILESDFVEFVDTNSNTSKKITLENVAKSISHGDLGGLTTANDHPQYALAGHGHPQYSLVNHNHLITAGVRREATQSIANNTHTAIIWDTKTFDTSNFWSSGQNVTVPYTGVYLINVYALFDGFTTGMALLEIFFNNETNARAIQGYLLNQYGIHMNLTTFQFLDHGSTIHVKVFQTSGSAKNVGGSSYPARIVVAKLA